MQPREVEIWALHVLDQIASNAPYETSRVELKLQWPDPRQAARRIAAHANSARGNPILWLIGVDDKHGITGAATIDLAKWWTQVRAEFDQIAPHLVDTAVPWQGKTVFALGFTTDLAPYLVKNPTFGKPGGGAVRFEVPWRAGTSTETADRSHLLLILAPTPKLPQFEILEAQLMLVRSNPQGVQKSEWNLSMLIYVTPRSSERVALAGHRISASHEVPSEPTTEYRGEVVMFPMGWRDGSYTPFVREPNVHPTIRGTNFDLTIDGPGLIKIICTTTAERIGALGTNRVARLKVAPTGSDLAVELFVVLRHNPRTDLAELWTAP